MNKNVWGIVASENSESLTALFDFLMIEYCRIFGIDTMTNESCIIYNDTNAKFPTLIINRNPIQIRLAQSSLTYWAQTIFQLSHELCHYAIRQHKADKNFTLSWFEEILCEAMSLYALQFASQNWDQCKLFEYNPDFASAIDDYLKSELNKTGTAQLSNCATIESLKEYETHLSGERETHRNERNTLYYAISFRPDDCRFFCDYTKYLDEENRITIDFSKWENDDSCPVIKELHKLQPCCNAVKEIVNA